MTKTLHGKVHGKTIELDEDLGVAEVGGSISGESRSTGPKMGRRHSSLGGRLGRPPGNRCHHGKDSPGTKTGATASN